MAKRELENLQEHNAEKTSRSAKRNKNAKPVKKSSILSKILCIVLGLIVGFVGAIGGIVGAGYFALTKITIKDAVDKVNSMAGLNISYTDYVTEEYGNGTTLALILALADAAKELSAGTGSLNTLHSISPQVGKNVQKLIEKAEGYGVDLSYEEAMSTPFSQLGSYLTENVNKTEIAPVIKAVTQNEVEGLLAAICYGEEGEAYIYDENGELVFLGDATPATIGSLTDSEMLNKRLMGLSFYTFMSAMGDVDASDPMIRTLVYGIEDEDYIVHSDGSIEQLPLLYEFVEAENHFVDHDENIFAFVDDGVWTEESGSSITLREDTTTYQYTLTDAEGNVIYSLKRIEEGSNLYQAYISDVPQVRKGFYMRDVVGSDSANLVNDIPLSSVLGISSPFEEDTEALLIMLAFGEEDIHYERCADPLCECENGWHFLTDDLGKPYKKRTIGDLTASGDSSLFNDLTIATLMNVDHNSEAIMRAIAYGNEGTHYKFLVDDEGNKTGIEMLPKLYFKSTVNPNVVLDRDGNEVGTFANGGVEVAAGVYEVAISEDSSQFVRLDSESNGYLVYKNLEDAVAEVNPIPYAKTKLVDLRGSNSGSYIDRIEMHTIFSKPEGSDHGTVMNYILYNDVTADPTSEDYHPRTLGEFTKNSGTIINGLTVQKLLANDIYFKVKLGAPDASGIALPDEENGVETLCIPIYDDNFTAVAYRPVTRTETKIGDKTYFRYIDTLGNEVNGTPLKGCWKYLLVDKTEGLECESSIDTLGSMTDNITTNMQSATLNELYTDKLLDMDPATLKKDILYDVNRGGTSVPIVPVDDRYYDKNGNLKTKLGQLNVFEAIGYISRLMNSLEGN